MSQELHYTSVPRGLHPGSKGFCVVATTPNLSAPLRERLEGLSGYQQVFPSHDPRAGLNPVVLAHHRLNLGGRPLSVLSRVAFAGLDYTDRSNKYAHHIVIDPSERPAGGPAWLLGRPGFLERTWRGEPRILPPGRAIPQGDSAPGIASAWRSATGDAGWAGALAEAFLKNPSRPAHLIYEPGFDPLPLFAEALALLPPARRWDVDFNTYFTVAPQGLTCVWRGVLAGTPAAAQALKAPGALVLDLTRPMGSPADGPLIQQARTGERPAAPPPTTPPRVRAPLAGPSRVEEFATSLPPDDGVPFVELAPDPPPAPRRGVRTADRPRTPAASRSRFHAARLWVSATTVLLLLLGGGSAFLYFGGGSGAGALLGKPIPRNEDKPPAPAPPKVVEAPKPKAEVPKQEPPPPPENPAVAVVEEPKQEAAQPLFVDLPEIPTQSRLGRSGTPKPAVLALEAGVLDLTLHPANGSLKLKPAPEPEPLETKAWAVGPNDPDDEIRRGPFHIALLKVEGGNLIIDWNEQSIASPRFPELAEALRDSVLELKIGKDRRFIVLRNLNPAKEIQLSGTEKPIPYNEAVIESWATGLGLDRTRWNLEVRRYRLDVIDIKDGKHILAQWENSDGKLKTEFDIVPGAVSFGVKPDAPVAGEPESGEPLRHGGKLSITFRTYDQYAIDRGDMKKYEEEITSAQGKIDRLKQDKEKNAKGVEKNQKIIDETEAKKRELQPRIHKYNLIEHNKSLSLSLIIGLRLDDGTFLDLARIGKYAEAEAQK